MYSLEDIQKSCTYILYFKIVMLGKSKIWSKTIQAPF